MRIILLGPAGSGKGTQGELIERHYGFPHISTGDLFRLEVMKGSELGKWWPRLSTRDSWWPMSWS